MALRAVVIGAGLAGTAVARALAQRGVKVTIVESGPCVASGASGNPAAIILPHLAIEPNPTFHFSNLGRKFLLDLLSRSTVMQSSLDYDLCGVLSLARDELELRRMDRALSAGGCPELTQRVSQELATQIAGVTVKGEGIFFSRAGWVDPVALCRANLHSSAVMVEILSQTHVARIAYERAGLEGIWYAFDQHDKVVAAADVCIVANGFDCKKFLQTSGIPLFRVRGQLESVQPNSDSEKLQTVVSYGGYVTPQLGSRNPRHVAGATFDWKDLAAEVRPSDTRTILSSLSEVLPCFEQIDGDSRVSFRATSPDTLPMVGQVCDARSERGKLQRLQGLYTTVGHGSRGLLYTQIAGEILAAQICGSPLPVPKELLAAIDPARFMLRAWRKPLRN